MTSWVIVRIETGEGIAETFDEKHADNICMTYSKYKKVPIKEYLYNLNEQIKERTFSDGGRAWLK